MSLEKEKLHAALTAAFNEFIDAFSAFDESQINKKPAPGRWTPAQIAIHIILATDGVPDQSTKVSDREVDLLLPHIRPWWEDLSQKFKSPGSLQPDEQARSKHEVLKELDRVRKKDLDILESQDLTMICLGFELPGVGYLTRYEWLWFIEMHLKRHTFQLKNMKPV
ncbi:MAG TPA: DinB family protein [Cyclobacteriaceae bacterium]|nr:DinB family protein [Cyclobacteriaceae bacterium]